MSETGTTSDVAASWTRRLLFVVSVSMLIAAALSVIATLSTFQTSLRPFLLAKTESVALSVAGNVEYALSVGVPFDRLRGLDALVEDMKAEHSEVLDIEIIATSPSSDSEASRLSTAGSEGDGAVASYFNLNTLIDVLRGHAEPFAAVTSPITRDGVAVAYVQAHVNSAVIVEQMQNVFFDSLVVMIAVTLVAFEIVVVASGNRITGPLRLVEAAIRRRAAGDLSQYQAWGSRGLMNGVIARLNGRNAELRDRAKRFGVAAAHLVKAYRLDATDAAKQTSIIDARIPLFVFCVAEELQKSFLPLFVAEYYQTTDFFDKSIMVGLPISAFMFVIAVITPFAGALVDRFGSRRLFLLGLLPALLGYLGCFLATSADDIVLSRSLTAIGYAVITISAQSYIAAVATKENRARSMAIFVGVLMAATMCGTAIGGILADWLGYKSVFIVSILLASIAGGLGFAMLSGETDERTETIASGSKRANPLIALSRNGQFVMIVLFCAIPAKIILTGFLYLFVPIYLASLDATQSEIGRIMMIYSLIIIPISPLASRFADKLNKNTTLVIGATVLSGIVLTGLYQSTSVAGVLLIVAALGVAHAFIKAPLIVAAMEAAEASPEVTRTSAMSLLRTFERVGSVVGPVIVAAMMVWLDYQTTAALLGLGVVLVGLVMAMSVAMGKVQKQEVVQ